MTLRWLAMLSLSALPLRAQVIPIKTIPIAQGDQFQLFPANNLGLGSVSIALPDTLGDPFVNPALGTRVTSTRLFTSPTLYSVSKSTGGGRSLPFAMLVRRGAWFGGVAGALQQVDPSKPPSQGFIAWVTPASPPPPPSPALLGSTVIDTTIPIPSPDMRAHGNEYAFGMLGRDFARHNVSVGASMLWTGLHALDGVDLLYAGSTRVAQTGHVLDVRLGAVKTWPGQGGEAGKDRTLETLLLHNDFAADHRVSYVDSYWDPGTATLRPFARIETNRDRTHTWGLELKYAMPLAATGWRIGWMATANAATHPKIPNYELSNVPVIPRDPGHTAAYDLGVGLSKIAGPATFGIDVVYEPIRSYTWADAGTPQVTASGDTIGVGGKTLENHFHFSNALLRLGAGRDIAIGDPGKTIGLQFGLMVRSTDYTLFQTDHVQELQRQLKTGWVEWTPTWGFSVRFPEFELRYRGRVTHGAGRPESQFATPFGAIALASGTILAAPSGPLNLMGVATTTHQISLSLPLR
jgi:hypothetical protein